MYKKIYISIAFFVGALATYAQPTANISGPTKICDNDSAELTITFTDVSPWEINYVRFYTINGSDYFQDTIKVTGITDNPYSLFVHYQGNYYLDSVINVNGSGSVSGAVTLSKYFPPTTSTISGSAIKCPYDSIDIPIALTGESPWKITYNINGSGSYVADGITSTNYDLRVIDSGTYTIIKVEDKNCTGSNTGNYLINNYTLPNVTAYGSDTICKNALSSIFTTFSGDAPWSLKYVKNSTDTSQITSINTSSYSFNVKGEGTYKIFEVSDAHCTKTVSETIEKPAYANDNVEISGLNNAYSVNGDSVHMSGTPYGGQFLGKGVISTDSLFYPSIAGTVGSPHDIIYRYTNPYTGCITDDTAVVNVISANAYIVFPDGNKNFCFYTDSVVIEGVNLNDIIGSFSISGNPSGIKNIGNNLAVIYPPVLNNGSFTITYTYNDGDILTIDENITIDFVETPAMNDLSNTLICKGKGKILMSGNSVNGTFIGSAIEFNTNEEEYYYNTANAKTPTDTIIYKIESTHGCILDTTQIVTVYNIPSLSFTSDLTCVSEMDLLPIKFINNTLSTDSVTQWEWNFGDATSSDNISLLKSPSHVYSKSGPRNVQLVATTTTGCSDTLIKIIDFKNAPVADINLSSVCYNQGIPINITNNTTGNTLKQTNWKIFDADTNELLDTSAFNLSYTFPALNNYHVYLTVVDTFNCTDTLFETLHLKPVFTLTEDTFYNQGFEQASNWYAFSADTLVSWKYGKPSPTIYNIPVHGNIWYTNITQRSLPEQSWIESPCFDLSDVQGATISLDVLELFEKNRDGAVLQYALNTPENWKNAGTVNQGINWFNAFEVNGEPGNQTIGWSNSNTEWKTSKTLIDNLAGNNQVLLRIAYGSDGTTLSNQGIAIDNITINPRFNKSIAEIFLNANTIVNNNLNELFNSAEINSDIIPIQYHTNYPVTDSLYLFNPSIVSARQLFYSAPNEPFIVLNGQQNFNLNNEYPATNTLNNSLIKDVPIKLFLNDTITGNNLNTKVTIKAKKNTSLNNLVLFTIITENNISYANETYTNVARYIMPDNGGYSLGGFLNEGDSIEISFEKLLSENISRKNIQVVSFIQNANTKEIVQATIDSSYFKSIVNNIYTSKAEKIQLYPNPVTNYLFIQMPNGSDRYIISIHSIDGKLLLKEQLESNFISVSQLKKGIYLISLQNDKREQFFAKFIKQ